MVVMNKRDMEVAAFAWDAAVDAIRYSDGTRPEFVAMVNPYKQALEAGVWLPSSREAADG